MDACAVMSHVLCEHLPRLGSPRLYLSQLTIQLGFTGGGPLLAQFS